MKMRFAVQSRNRELLSLVRDFGVGLGFTTEPGRPTEIVLSQREGTGDHLLDLLGHVALCSAKTGSDAAEPLCTVTYRPGDAPSDVRIGLRIAGFDLLSAATAGQ